MSKRVAEPDMRRAVKTYPLAGVGSLVLRHRLSVRTPGVEIRAVKTGEFRPPRAGEWFLSGAVPEGYETKNDLSTPYHILRLVRVRRVETEVVEPFAG
jgi:hypothetical protein